MFPVIDKSVSCKIRAVISFIHAKFMTAAEIRCELYATVYGQNVIDETPEDTKWSVGHLEYVMVFNKTITNKL
jgi:predicted NAD-dependent protein-ADP-ribosyltransferase YbiA (DUF1768 family)